VGTPRILCPEAQLQHPSLPEAGILRSILHEHGIEAVIDNAGAPIPTAAPPTLLVADADEEEALRLIREHVAKKP
jgi:hypothetical protein